MQILSIIAERGGETPSGLWQVLMKDGPFENVGKADFLGLLKGLGDKKLVEQVQGGVLLLGQVGEELVAKHDFCLAFSTAEEFRILHEGQVLGSLPMARPLPPHSRIIFAGRRWLVADMDEQEKLIFVTPSPGGLPPSFSGGGFHVHDKVRATMRAFLEADSLPSFLDEDGRRLLGEARFWFKELELGKRSWIPYGHGVFLFPWRGDSVHDALALALCHCGIGSTNEGIGVLAEGSSDEVAEGLLDLASDKALDPLMLLSDARGLLREKWDWALPEGLLMRSYAASLLDFDGAREAAGELSGSLEGG
jgi:ATP-dependent Lhr-like helicase